VLGPRGVAVAVAVTPERVLDASPAAGWELVRRESGLGWHPGEPVPDELRFMQAAWEVAIQRLAALPPHRLATRCAESSGERVDRGAASDPAQPPKPGIGGSATAASLVTAAMYALAGADLRAPASRQRVLAAALEAHRRGQRGRGSGYDVATIVHGGLVVWRPAAGAEPLAWPPALQLVAGFTGSSARTTDQLRRLEERRLSATQRVDAELAELSDEVELLVQALRGGDVRQILQRTRACQSAVARWDRRHELGVVTKAARAMVQIAEAAGAAGRISGAGGGDSVIALHDDPAVMQAVRDGWLAAGYRVLDSMATASGVTERCIDGICKGPIR
jgi:mevalonate kinase